MTLGHAAADVTQIYAERDMELAAKVMREVACPVSVLSWEGDNAGL